MNRGVSEISSVHVKRYPSRLKYLGRKISLERLRLRERRLNNIVLQTLTFSHSDSTVVTSASHDPSPSVAPCI